MDQAKRSDFLNPQHVAALASLDIMLSGHVARPELNQETRKLASDVRGLMDAVRASGIHDQCKQVILKRLMQIASALDHFYIIGPEALNEDPVADWGCCRRRPNGRPEER